MNNNSTNTQAIDAERQLAAVIAVYAPLPLLVTTALLLL